MGERGQDVSVKRSDLRPGDVVFPAGPTGSPWIVLAWEEGRMLYMPTDGKACWWESDGDHTFQPFVLIVRGGEAVNGRFP